MYRARRLTGVVLAIALLAILVQAAGAGAQERDGTEVVQLTPTRDSGVSGTVTLEDIDGGVEVTLYMRGLGKPGTEYVSHIHVGGTCADDLAGRTVPPKIPLKSIVGDEDRTGSATTTIKDVTVAELFSEGEERYINFHAEAGEGEGLKPGISCADLTPSAQQSTEVQLTPSRDSGVNGTAILEDVEGGVEIALYMRGLAKPGTQYISHIHAGGTCADDRAGRPAPATITLKPLVADKGGDGFTAARIEGISVGTLFGEYRHRYINFHAKAEEDVGIPPGITCGDLTPLPGTGGISPATVMLLAGTILALGATAGLFAGLRRRDA